MLQVLQKAAIDTLIIRGENAAKANYNTLLSIKNRVGIVNNEKNNKAKLPLFYPQYAPSNDNQLRIGLRFDSEDIAAVILNINLNKQKNSGKLRQIWWYFFYCE